MADEHEIWTALDAARAVEEHDRTISPYIMDRIKERARHGYRSAEFAAPPAAYLQKADFYAFENLGFRIRKERTDFNNAFDPETYVYTIWW